MVHEGPLTIELLVALCQLTKRHGIQYAQLRLADSLPNVGQEQIRP